MTPKHWILPLSLMLTLSTTAGLALANDANPPSDDSKLSASHHHHGGGHHGQCTDGDMKKHMEAAKKDMDDFLTSIGVTEDQKKQMKDLREASRKDAEPIHQSLRDQRKDLMGYINSPDATETGALEKEQAIDKLQAQLSERRIKSMFQTRAILSAEQQQKLSAHMKEKMEHWKAEHPEKTSDNPDEPQP